MKIDYSGPDADRLQARIHKRLIGLGEMVTPDQAMQACLWAVGLVGDDGISTEGYEVKIQLAHMHWTFTVLHRNGRSETFVFHLAADV